MPDVASNRAAVWPADHGRFQILPADQSHAVDLRHLIEQGFRTEGARWAVVPGIQHAEPVRLDEVRTLIAAPANRLLAALDRETLVGCVLISRLSADVCALGLLGVDAACRGRGLGTHLIAAAEAQAVAAFGSSRIELCVHARDRQLVGYYEHRGFHRTGELRNYAYRNAAAEFAVMAKTLATTPAG